MATYLPFADVVAAYGYRQPPPVKTKASSLLLALAYVVMGGALGTVAGTTIAVASFHSGIAAGIQRIAPAVEASTTTKPAVATPTEISIPAVLPISSAEAKTKPSPIKRATLNQVAFRFNPHVHARIVSVAKPAQTMNATLTLTSTHVPVAAPVSASDVAFGAKSYTFMSEGDVTVADFDTAMGTLETYEGRTFVLGTAVAPPVVSSLQDSGTSVHYRCDQNGNCTLMRAGLVMQHVRLM